MSTTLFGVVESKRDSAARAKKLADLWATEQDLPESIEAAHATAAACQYFIDRSNRHALDPNDWDGLIRFCDTTECLEDEDRAEMESHPEAWRPYSGEWKGWAGMPETASFAVCLHAKELEFLTEAAASQDEEAAELEAYLAAVRAEIASLRAVGPLPADLANKYGLTEDGDLTEKRQPPTFENSVVLQEIADDLPEGAIQVQRCTQPDPEAHLREHAGCTAPRSEILDAPPLECEQPTETTAQAEARALALGFGTRTPKPVRPACQDNLFDPIPQGRLF